MKLNKSNCVGIIFILALSACQTTPPAARSLSSTPAQPEDSRLKEAVALEALGFFAEALILDRESARLNARLKLKHYERYQMEVTPSFAFEFVPAVLFSAGLGTGFFGSSAGGPPAKIQFLVEKLFSGRALPLMMSFGTSFVGAGYSTSSVMLPRIQNQKDAEESIMAPMATLQYVFLRKPIEKEGAREDDKNNQEVKAAFVKSLRTTANELATRAQLLLDLRSTDRAILTVQIEGQLSKAFGEDEVWRKNAPVKIDLANLLAKVDHDLRARLVAIDSILRDAQSKNMGSGAPSRRAYDDLIIQVDQLSKKAADIYVGNARSHDPRVVTWAERNLRFSEDLEKFMARLKTQEQLLPNN